MEGVSAEASSYAGLQKLDKLIVLYDSNDINLDGETKDSFTEDVRARYEAYGWNTEFVQDGTDIEAINAAIESAKASGKPSLIEVKTVIGHGAPNKQGTNGVLVLLLDQMKQQLQEKTWVGTMLHLKFQKKFMLISRKIQLIVVVRPMTLGLLW